VSSNLLRRIAFAVVAIPAVVAVAWVGRWPFTLLLAAAAALGARELFGFARAQGFEPLGRTGMLGAALAPVAMATIVMAAPGAPLIREGYLLVAFLLAVLCLALLRRGPGGRPLTSAAVTVLGALYPGFLLSYALVLRHPHPGLLATDARVASIDYTGGSDFGRWLLDNAHGKQIYAELSGVNNVVIESSDNYKGLLRNLAFTLCLYSGQMCTTTKALLVPASGIDTDQGHKSFDEVAADLGAAIEKLLSDPATATAVLGAIQSPHTLERIAAAPRAAAVVLASRRIAHPEYPNAEIHTPVLLKADAAREDSYMQERFGPISTVVAVPGGPQALAELSERIVREHGALTVGVYSTKPDFIDAMTEATQRAGVALSINLTGGVFVNQSAGFSDYHGTGANPAANASYTDSAFVASRFRVIQRRHHV